MQRALEHGDEQVDKGTKVKTYSLFGAQMRFDLSEGLPVLTTKRVYWKGVLHELYWFMSGKTNIKYLVDNEVHIWDDYPYKIYNERVERKELPAMTKEEFIAKIKTDDSFAKEHGELPHIYGEHWRRWIARDGRTVDQLGWVIDELRKDPDAHNTLVTSWNPEYMYAMARPGEGARFPICHNLYQVNIKNGKGVLAALPAQRRHILGSSVQYCKLRAAHRHYCQDHSVASRVNTSIPSAIFTSTRTTRSKLRSNYRDSRIRSRPSNSLTISSHSTNSGPNTSSSRVTAPKRP